MRRRSTRSARARSGGGGRLWRAAPALLIALLAAAAIVAVVLALPNGARPDTGVAAAGAASTRSSAGAVGGGPQSGDAPGRTIAAPALAGSTTAPTESGVPTSDQPPTDGPSLGGEQTAATTSDPATAARTAGPTTAPATTPTTSAPARSATAPARTAPSATAPRTTTPAADRPTGTPPSPSTPPTKPRTSTAPPKTTAPQPPSPAAPDFGIPVSLGNATQLITVTAPSKTATTGTLRAWEKTSVGTWRVVFGPVTANLGSAGIGPASESYSRTPLGTFTMTQAFGALANPGTALPYHRTGPNDWWVSDVQAASYNTMQTCPKASCPFNTRLAEHLQTITPYYDYAVVMDVNRSPVVKGGGSAFFLHVTVGRPTEGCVAIARSTLVDIMRWLTPSAHPRIATGIA